VNFKFFTWIDNQLHAANLGYEGDAVEGVVAYPNRIIRSPVDQPDNIAFYDYYDFDIGDGDSINGIETLFGRSVIFKTRKYGVFYNGSWENTHVPGLASINGFYKKDTVIYFISDVGLHVFDGRQSINMKNAVKVYFDAASSYANATVFFFDNKDRIIWSLRGDRSFVWNAIYKRWMYYTASFAFRGYFKNFANEYIAWDGTQFYELFDGSTKDAEDVGGGNGTAIACSYESPLVRFNQYEGELVTLIGARHRLRKNSGDSLALNTYEFQNDASGKTLVATHSLTYQGNVSYAAVVNMFFNALLGESYSFQLQTATPSIPASDDAVFEYHGMTIEYVGGGYKE